MDQGEPLIIYKDIRTPILCVLMTMAVFHITHTRTRNKHDVILRYGVKTCTYGMAYLEQK